MISKKAIFNEVDRLLNEKISITELAMKEAQSAANNETKSSAGDKYETGRAMSQNEKDINARHLADLIKMKRALDLIDPVTPLNKVELGAIVKTDELTYFISIGLGIIQLKGENVMTISAISPIGQCMIGRVEGDSFEWRGNEEFIRKVL
ncbi:MAG: GreA/GreB family elongation factor [Reichenbachiella sp.]